MKKIVVLAVVIVLIIAGVWFVPKITHTCDDCGKFFFGAGYEPGVLEDLFSSEDQIICRDCAKEQHALSLTLGKSVDDFKREIFA